MAFAGRRRSGPISRISFVLRGNLSSKRMAVRTRRRTQRSKTPRVMRGSAARDFVYCDFQMILSLADCRSSSSAFAQRFARHDPPLPWAVGEGAALLRREAGKVAEGRMGYGQPPRTQVGLHKRRRELPESGGLLSTPYPALRATFPSRAGEGSARRSRCGNAIACEAGR